MRVTECTPAWKTRAVRTRSVQTARASLTSTGSRLASELERRREKEKKEEWIDVMSWTTALSCGLLSHHSLLVSSRPIILYWCLLAPSLSAGVSSPHHSLLVSPLPIFLYWCLLSPSFSTSVSSPHHSLLVSPLPIILYWCLSSVRNGISAFVEFHTFSSSFPIVDIASPKTDLLWRTA